MLFKNSQIKSEPEKSHRSVAPSYAQLEKAEGWLWQKFVQAKSPRTKVARLRMWFIFIFLRYGALRLEEIFKLDFSQIDFKAASIFPSRKGQSREVPMPLPVMQQMRSAWECWPGANALKTPFKCDASLVRKSLSCCAEKCSAGVFSLNVRILRKYREKELLRKGLEGDFLPLFLGLGSDIGLSASSLDLSQLHHWIHNENLLKSSARNAFYGEVAEIGTEGILARIVIATVSGLRVEAIITQTSRNNLRLSVGSLIMALVKAPWVKVNSQNLDDLAKNCFEGKIEEIKTDGKATEILTRLSHGQLICALYIESETLPADFAIGDIVRVSFSPLSVILAAPR